MMENGLRLQVKSAHATYVNSRSERHRACHPQGVYIFNLRRGWRDKERGRLGHRAYAGIADFFVLWGIEDDRFFIVPTSIKNRAISFTRTDRVANVNSRAYLQQLRESRSAEYENRWDLLDINSVVNGLTVTVPKAGEYAVSAEIAPKGEN